MAKATQITPLASPASLSAAPPEVLRIITDGAQRVAEKAALLERMEAAAKQVTAEGSQENIAALAVVLREYQAWKAQRAVRRGA